MNDYFGRAGPQPYGRARSPSTFRDSLADLRDTVREGLAEAASRAVARAARRVAACLLGVDDAIDQARPVEYWNTGWGYEDYDDPDGWGGEWRGPHGWLGRNEGEQDDQHVDRPGSWRRVAAVCCQALAWLIRTLMPAGPLGALARTILAALALLLGGADFACEGGLTLAESAWALAEFLTADAGADDAEV